MCFFTSYHRYNTSGNLSSYELNDSHYYCYSLHKLQNRFASKFLLFLYCTYAKQYHNWLLTVILYTLNIQNCIEVYNVMQNITGSFVMRIFEEFFGCILPTAENQRLFKNHSAGKPQRINDYFSKQNEQKSHNALTAWKRCLKKNGMITWIPSHTLVCVCVRLHVGASANRWLPRGSFCIINTGICSWGAYSDVIPLPPAYNFNMISTLLTHSPINLLHCYYSGRLHIGKKNRSAHLFLKVNNYINSVRAALKTMLVGKSNKESWTKSLWISKVGSDK